MSSDEAEVDALADALLETSLDTALDTPSTTEAQLDAVLGASPALDAILDDIQSGAVERVLVMTGAGVSVAAGIPDFRTPGTGLYSNLEAYDLPYPEAIFEIDFFRDNPRPFYTLAKDLWPGLYAPTQTHRFIKTLAEKGLLLRNYTQNIDGLERVAGLEQELLVEAHGDFYSAACIDCSKHHEIEFVKERMEQGVPQCTDCSGYVKPSIVFFGEDLPSRFHTLSAQDVSQTDLLIVMGTSLAVQPFASLLHRVPRSCRRILINREPIATNPFSPHPFQFESGSRDVFLQGDCDAVVQRLAQRLGWEL